jgi:lactate permease
MQAQWFHNYCAVGNNIGLTALVVSLPIWFLFWAFSVKRMRGYIAASLALLLTIVVTILTYRMPVPVALSAAALGSC